MQTGTNLFNKYYNRIVYHQKNSMRLTKKIFYATHLIRSQNLAINYNR